MTWDSVAMYVFSGTGNTYHAAARVCEVLRRDGPGAELKWLERQGLISLRSRGIELHDVQGLQTLVDKATADGTPEE